MPENEFPPSLKFHYIKGNFFRVVHADGAIGGLTPSRQIFMSVYSERSAIPKVIEMEVSSEGNLGNEIRREGKDGLVRELEVGIMLSASAAEAIAAILLQHAKAIKESIRETQGDSISSTE
jgi:hypothetical protein